MSDHQRRDFYARHPEFDPARPVYFYLATLLDSLTHEHIDSIGEILAQHQEQAKEKAEQEFIARNGALDNLGEEGAYVIVTRGDYLFFSADRTMRP